MAARKTKPPDLASLAASVEVLKGQVEAVRRHITDMAGHFTALAEEIAWVRKRLASVLPERHHCPFCKAIIHKDAKTCGACGRTWERKVGGTGLPT